jgi:hypothetical protein
MGYTNVNSGRGLHVPAGGRRLTPAAQMPRLLPYSSRVAHEDLPEQVRASSTSLLRSEVLAATLPPSPACIHRLDVSPFVRRHAGAWSGLAIAPDCHHRVFCLHARTDPVSGMTPAPSRVPIPLDGVSALDSGAIDMRARMTLVVPHAAHRQATDPHHVVTAPRASSARNNQHRRKT